MRKYPFTPEPGWSFSRVRTLQTCRRQYWYQYYGKRYIDRDYVILSALPQAVGQVPAHEAEVQGVPKQLGWEPVPGAGHYQVFIRDLWNEGKLIFSSKVLDEPVLPLPDGLLEPGGYYSWIVHARDLNEHFMLGDFNHGSISPVYTFSIAP